MSSLEQIREQTKREIEKLAERVAAATFEPTNALSELAEKNNEPRVAANLKQVRFLKGHYGKVYALGWSSDSKRAVSASQDGKLILWNAFTTAKDMAVALRSSWVMTCAFSPEGMYVASGGLDNICSLYAVPAGGRPGDPTQVANIKPLELAVHDGYLSACRFISDREIISASGDQTCILWDLEHRRPRTTFLGHQSDVMCLAIFGDNTFISGSCDATAKLWDIRAGNKSQRTFQGNQSDVNSIRFFPDGNAFATGSDDSSARLFDIRACRQINSFVDSKMLSPITSVDFSGTGQMLFAGYDDGNVLIWDTAFANTAATLSGHDSRVSCLEVSVDGKALCTGSWDSTVRVWGASRR